MERIASISRLTSSLGRRYSGIPRISIPPATAWDSKIVQSWPSLARSWAQVSPAGPEPMMATRFPVFAGFKLPGAVEYRSVSARAKTCLVSTPYRSVANRFSARIEMGSFSTTPFRQTSSHGWAQTLPQMEAKGLGPRAMA